MQVESEVGAQMGAVPDRRLDELAWLLEGPSMCTAVAVVGDKFLVSANEFSERTRIRTGNEQLNFICTIMEYFKKIAKREINESQRKPLRDELMKAIFKHQIRTSSFGRISVADEIVDAVIKTDVLHNERMPQGILDSDMAHIALGYGIMINRRLRKIENSIDKALSGDFSELSESQLKAFADFSHDDGHRENSNILFFEKEAGVHAELQILSKVVGMAENSASVTARSIYIGISKRCCLQCDCMLKAANETLAAARIGIEYAGTHGASFAANWTKPYGFTEILGERASKKVASSSSAKPTPMTMQQEIYQKYLALLKDAIEVEGQYSQRGGASDSDYSSKPEEKINAYREQFEADLDMLQRRGVGSSELAKTLELGLDLCKLEDFNELFEEAILSKIRTNEEIQDRFNDILSSLNIMRSQGQRSTIGKEVLMAFLSDPNFSPSQIAECFSKLSARPGITSSASAATFRFDQRG